MNERDNPEVWALVLAAGKSERMGRQKLLLPWGDQTVIEAVIDNIILAGINKIMAVVGSQSEEIARVLGARPVTLCFNSHFAEGMHTSVIQGFSNIPESAGAVMVFLGDQPFIPTDVIKNVFHSWQSSGKGIVIAAYHGIRGHPTLFDMKYREEIIHLDRASGLRSLADKFPGEVLESETNYPEITRDIDTKNDYLNELIKSKKYGKNPV